MLVEKGGITIATFNSLFYRLNIFNEDFSINTKFELDPATIYETVKHPSKGARWREAAYKKINTLIRTGTLRFINRDKIRRERLIRAKIIFTKKRNVYNGL